ncbi:hypothetical protein MD484_g1649, partial [Candolleomyces efflorescens]
MDPILLAALKVEVDQGYSIAAALTFVLCDIISKLGDERKYIWKARWSPAKVMYFLTRYYGLIVLIAIFAAYKKHNPSPEL